MQIKELVEGPERTYHWSLGDYDMGESDEGSGTKEEMLAATRAFAMKHIVEQGDRLRFAKRTYTKKFVPITIDEENKWIIYGNPNPDFDADDAEGTNYLEDGRYILGDFHYGEI